MINGLTLCLINTEVLCWVMVLLSGHISICQSEALLTSTVLLQVLEGLKVGFFLKNLKSFLHYVDNKSTKESIMRILWIIQSANRTKN